MYNPGQRAFINRRVRPGSGCCAQIGDTHLHYPRCSRCGCRQRESGSSVGSRHLQGKESVEMVSGGISLRQQRRIAEQLRIGRAAPPCSR
jgi:hypothetical protein